MTIYLARHGSAGVRDDTDIADDLRPLDPVGESQAHKLAEWLVHEPIQRVISSPYLRCRQTVEPLASRLGLQVEVDAALAEGALLRGVWKLMESLVGQDAVLCSHGDVIPEFIRAAQLRGMHVPGKSGSAKGSVWTLKHWSDERFAIGIYTPIPG